jgi:hypothetical protein
MKTNTALMTKLSYEDFLYSLHDPGVPAPALSPKLFGAALQIDMQTLADQAHVHRNTLRRAPTTATVQRHLRESMKAIKAAYAISGDLDKALLWYRNDGIETFAYKTAEELVSAGRTEDLLGYLASLQAGFAG